MTLSPFFAAPLHIQSHILAALLVLALTPVQFFGPRKGSGLHRVSGYAWLLAMGAVALSSLFIRTDFPLAIAGFGPIHVLSCMMLAGILQAVRLARAHRVGDHAKSLRMLTYSFLAAGAFTLLPSRIMGRMIFGP